MRKGRGARKAIVDVSDGQRGARGEVREKEKLQCVEDIKQGKVRERWKGKQDAIEIASSKR
jgi:hypothetical protein